MANILLRDSDAVSMHNGLELRVPFLDGDLVRYALQLPGEFRMRAGSIKPLLLDAIQEILPPSLLSTSKRGFELPFSLWLQDWPQPQLDPSRLGSIWPDRVQRARTQFLRKPAHCRSWWQWTVLAAWINAWPSLLLTAEQ
jgi:asparagine synthase (glutamine-hydrolysing)